MTRRLGSTPRKQFCSVLIVFLVHGVEGGAYTVLLADLARAIELSDSALGVALAVLAASSGVTILFAGRIADRFGRRVLLSVGALGVGSFYGGLAVADSYPVLLVAVVVGGVFFSLLDLSPPTIGGDYERRHGSEALTGLYAGLDAAGAVGAFGCGLALGLGVSYRLVYLVVAILLVSLALASVVMPLPMNLPANPPSQDPVPHAPARVPVLTKAVVLAALLVGLVSLLDIALEGYSSRYLQDALGSGPLLAGTAIAVSFVVSGIARLGCSVALRRFDRSHVLIVAGLGMAVGTALLVVTPLPAVASIGLLALRAFEAPVTPLAYSVAGRSTPTRSGQANAVTWVARYGAFLVGPLAVGFVADRAGLRAALSLFILTSLAIGRPCLSPARHPATALTAGWGAVGRRHSRPGAGERVVAAGVGGCGVRVGGVGAILGCPSRWSVRDPSRQGRASRRGVGIGAPIRMSRVARCGTGRAGWENHRWGGCVAGGSTCLPDLLTSGSPRERGDCPVVILRGRVGTTG